MYGTTQVFPSSLDSLYIQQQILRCIWFYWYKNYCTYRNQRETCFFSFWEPSKVALLLGPYLPYPWCWGVCDCGCARYDPDCAGVSGNPQVQPLWLSANIYSFMLIMLMLLVFGVIQKGCLKQVNGILTHVLILVKHTKKDCNAYWW